MSEKEIKFKYYYQLHGHISGKNPKEWQSKIWTLDEIQDSNSIMGTFEYSEYYTLQHRKRFTGLKDKNDNDIYEGDIVKFFYDNQYWTGIVNFKIGSFYINVDDIISMFKCYDYSELEVLGNIYENSELIK